MRLVAQVGLYGIFAGTFYALMGVAWNVIYNTTRTFHFAHGTVFVAAAYTAALLSPAAGFIVASLAAVLVAIVIGCSIEKFIYQPVRRHGGTALVILIASLGTFILGENLLILLFTGRIRTIEGFPVTSLSLAGLNFTTRHVLTLVASLAAIAFLSLFLTRTRGGKAIRAVADNPLMAQVVGITRDRVYLLAFALGSVAAAVAAIVWGLDRSVLPTMSLQPLFAGFVVSIVGGLGSNKGAVIAGMMLGLVENLAQLEWAPEMANLVSYGVLILVLVVKPTGLFGSKVQRFV
jgi:branched-chain amino acid transport system permease protein